MSDDVRWRDVWLAFGVAVAVTLLLGAPLFLVVGQNVWWLAVAGVLGLVAGGWLVARQRGRSDALGATLVAILYFATVLVILFGGTLVDLLPDPLPGLPIGDWSGPSRSSPEPWSAASSARSHSPASPGAAR